MHCCWGSSVVGIRELAQALTGSLVVGSLAVGSPAGCLLAVLRGRVAGTQALALTGSLVAGSLAAGSLGEAAGCLLALRGTDPPAGSHMKEGSRVRRALSAA
jgi:hypothetical protein